MKYSIINGSNIIARIAELRKLTLQPNSGINNMLNRLEAEPAMRSRTFAVLVQDGDQLVGWLLAPNYVNKWVEFNMAIYIKPEYRRKGLARHLVEKALPLMKKDKPLVINWSEASGKFWNQFKDRVHILQY